VHALEPLRGLRVIADPAALDNARWQGDRVWVLRIAPDDAFAIGASGVAVDDEHAIVEDEAGFVGDWISLTEVLPHMEWSVPAEGPVPADGLDVAQGAIAGVPCKLWLTHPGDALLVTAAAYADELAGRLR
jgi:hypothetical protein